MPLPPQQICRCRISTPLYDKDGADSGLCSCGGVYDERLYEMQLRKHWPGLPENADLQEILQFIQRELPQDHPWVVAQHQ